MKQLAIDIETYSETDLKKAGVYRYTEDPSFEILLFGYSIDGEEPRVIDIAGGQPMPKEFISALSDPSVKKTAFNASFERTCLAKWYGIECPAEQWDDTMIRAAELGLPRSLADVGIVLGLAEDEQKMKEGRSLVLYFSKPSSKGRHLPADAPERWETFKEYCRRDVKTEQAIRRRIMRFRVDPHEAELWVLDQRINDRGVMLDTTFAENARECDSLIKEALIAKSRELTGLDNPKSVTQVKDWIRSETGLNVQSLEKSVIKEVREDLADYPQVLDFLDLRAKFNKTSTAKYEAMLRCVSEDGRMRGLTQFYGASRTGRWAGRHVQLQNLPQNHLPDAELDTARRLVRERDYETFEMLFEPETLSELLRTALIPKEGHEFIVSDFSAIEARVLAWLAGEAWRLEVFNTHGKIYEASAEQMFGLPPGSVKKGDPMRAKGKIAELALGYGGSVGAMMRMGALENGLEENELKPIVNTWRRANPSITSFWSEVERAAQSLMQTCTAQVIRHGITFFKEGPLMRVKLPSGRALSYVKPKPGSRQAVTFEGQVQAGGWGRQETYGAKLVENITQAVARDCLAESIRRLEERDIPVVFHVHDEVIVEVPKGTYTPEQIADIMSEPLSWAPDLPLKAAAYKCEYYKKD